MSTNHNALETSTKPTATENDTGTASGDNGASVPVTAIREWLDDVALIYRGHVARAAAEYEAHQHGLLSYDSEQALEDAVFLRGMWHMFAEIILRTGFPTQEKGRRLLEVDEQVPSRYRVLGIEPAQPSPDTSSWSDEAAQLATEFIDLSQRIRAARAFNTATEHAAITEERVLDRLFMATELLGYDPSDQPTSKGTHA